MAKDTVKPAFTARMKETGKASWPAKNVTVRKALAERTEEGKSTSRSKAKVRPALRAKSREQGR